MKNFTYFRPTSAEQAVALLSDRWSDSANQLLGGGTDLHDLQKEHVAEPDRVISLQGIRGLSGIDVQRNEVKIGAGTTLSEMIAHAGLRKNFPGFVNAAENIGGPQIRSVGTLGGNLCQRNRCWYFRDEHTNCLLKGGERCFAIDGENRYHAIFTQGHRCVIVNPSTLAPVLIALGATVEIQAPNGRRTINAADLYRAPNAPTQRETVLDANEMVLSVTIPMRGLVSASYKVKQTHGNGWPAVQAAVAFSRNNNKTQNAQIVLGHVAPTPHVATAAAQAINGQAINEKTAAAAGRAAGEGAKPLSQNAYKTRLVEVAVKRALLLASGARPYWEA